ncbi:uncharacterized protein HD556DRAFT_1449391 [Suillus plorans]|uniref:Integrase core domain-containing protein n=1 Tax=Suillus plorans TaxID=116603 RepID=A0A9P7DBL4_9AGAM|nr:uncharacterized protein HD556DRAFT_1449391 [Suillus plorans]KAG1786733.1 hypothetical protein HD556DRAFT_1449391 [Suillus plorans]
MPHILHFWKARQTDKMIVENLCKVIDTSRYGIGLTKFKEIRNAMGLQHTRQQDHTIESIRDAMVELREAYPNAGAQEMVSLLFHEKDMSVSRNIVISYFTAYEAGLVHQRKACRLQQRRFWAAGVNDLFTVNQHDKWLRFGLALHTGIEPFSGRIMWMRVWHLNHNPQLILTYYLNTVEKLGYIPMVAQSDPGSENYGIANHRWMRTKKNIMPEIAWSQLCRRFVPGYETLFDEGVVSGWYDSDNVLQVMVFRWVFIPWLQCELDRYQDCVNNTAKRRDHNKVLPHGVPNLIYESPEEFGAMDFKASFNLLMDGIDHVHQVYVKPDHPVFDLVPQALNQFIQHCYDDLGQPPLTRQSLPPMVDDNTNEDPLPLLKNQRDLLCANDADYMGGVHGGLSLDTSDHHRLDSLIEEDEPDTSLLPNGQVAEEEGLFAWFSDEGEEDETHEW